MRGPVLRVLAVSQYPLLQRASLSTHVSSHQPQKSAPARSQQRRHNLDPVGWWRLGHEADLTSSQAWRGPPCRSML